MIASWYWTRSGANEESANCSHLVATHLQLHNFYPLAKAVITDCVENDTSIIDFSLLDIIVYSLDIED